MSRVDLSSIQRSVEVMNNLVRTMETEKTEFAEKMVKVIVELKVGGSPDQNKGQNIDILV